jgi:hypothetical protein
MRSAYLELHVRIFGPEEKREVVDESIGLRVVREGKRIRVFAAGRTMLFVGPSPEQFLEYYRRSLEAINLDFAPISVDDRTLEFSEREQADLRRDIALHWIRYYLNTRQPVRIEPSDLNHPQTWSIVLTSAEQKYGSRSAEAMALAAHTVGASLQQFEMWKRVEADRVDNM